MDTADAQDEMLCIRRARELQGSSFLCVCRAVFVTYNRSNTDTQQKRRREVHTSNFLIANHNRSMTDHTREADRRVCLSEPGVRVLA